VTDRLKGFVVTLDHDMRDDDAENIRKAILALKHVSAVNPVASDYNDLINRQRVRQELGKKIIDVVFNPEE